jgi:hypothetical protein
LRAGLEAGGAGGVQPGGAGVLRLQLLVLSRVFLPRVQAVALEALLGCLPRLLLVRGGMLRNCRGLSEDGVRSALGVSTKILLGSLPSAGHRVQPAQACFPPVLALLQTHLGLGARALLQRGWKMFGISLYADMRCIFLRMQEDRLRL